MIQDSSIQPFFKGRVALHAILQAAGIGKGHQVLLPGYTCVVVPNAINYSGAQPVFLDIEAETFNLDCDRLTEGLGARWQPEKARAIIVQHSYGIPCNMDRIAAFAREYGLLVIEDSCHALGSRWAGRLVGSMGDAAFFSSQWSKPVTTGLGGWATINNPDLVEPFAKIKDLYQPPSPGEALLLEMQYLVFQVLNRPRLYWLIQNIYRKLGTLGLAIGSSSGDELACELPPDYAKGMHPRQRKRLEKLLAELPAILASRQEKTRAVESALQARGLATIKSTDQGESVFLRYPLLVENKPEVLAAARQKQIQIGDWFLSLSTPTWPPGTLPATLPAPVKSGSGQRPG